MRFLREYLHVIVFAILLLALLRLQFSSSKVGWPFPTGIEFVWLNVFPAIFVLGFSMLPFSYASQRTTTLGAFFLVTTCAAAASVLLPEAYRESFLFVDRLLIVSLMTMMLYGCASFIWSFIRSNVSLPSKTSRRNGT